MGVEALAVGFIQLRFVARTQPGKQWEVSRELRGRIERFLPEDDPLRAPALAAIDEGLAAWTEGVRALGAARREAALGRAELEAAQEALRTLLERTFGMLIQAHGRRAARRFFPKADRRDLKNVEVDDDDTLPSESP